MQFDIWYSCFCISIYAEYRVFLEMLSNLSINAFIDFSIISYFSNLFLNIGKYLTYHECFYYNKICISK